MWDAFDWLALAIGNSRLHWAWYVADRLQTTWDTPHFDAPAVAQMISKGWQFGPEVADLPLGMPLTIASVVPAQTALWQNYARSRVLTLADVPLHHLYPTLGIDRALTLWGAIQLYGAPVLVIDGGTALTFTGADAKHNLVGGAILPGMRSLFQTLHRSTAALPEVIQVDGLPDRWGMNTDDAIRSGIVHMVTAGVRDFVEDWWGRYPESAIVFTGGDGAWLGDQLQMSCAGGSRNPPPTGASIGPIIGAPQLIFVGMRAVLSPGCPIADPN